MFPGEAETVLTRVASIESVSITHKPYQSGILFSDRFIIWKYSVKHYHTGC